MEINISKQSHKEYLKKTNIRRDVPSQHYFWAQRLKATSPRIWILDCLKKSKVPLSPEEIRERLLRLSGSETNVHLATIYRTLNALVEAGVVWKIYPRTRKRALFEIKPVLGLNPCSDSKMKRYY